jgi:hypothetical protein
MKRVRPVVVLLAASLPLASCRVGPQYVRPAAPMVPTFKEPLPTKASRQNKLTILF